MQVQTPASQSPSRQQTDPQGVVPGSQHSPVVVLHRPSAQHPPGNSPQASVPGLHSHPGPSVAHWYTAALQQMPPLHARKPSGQHPTPGVHRSSGQHSAPQAMFTPLQHSSAVVHLSVEQHVSPQQIAIGGQQVSPPVPHGEYSSLQQTSATGLHCSSLQQPPAPQQASLEVLQHSFGSAGQGAKVELLTHAPWQQMEPSTQTKLTHCPALQSHPQVPSAGGPQSLASQQVPSTVRSMQVFALVPAPQQVVFPAQQRSALVEPPGQKSSAGQQTGPPGVTEHWVAQQRP